MKRRHSLIEREDAATTRTPRPSFGMWLADPEGRPQMFADVAAMVDWAATAYSDTAIEALLDAVSLTQPPSNNHEFVLAKLAKTPPPFFIWERERIEAMELTVISFATTREFLDDKARPEYEREECHAGIRGHGR